MSAWPRPVTGVRPYSVTRQILVTLNTETKCDLFDMVFAD